MKGKKNLASRVKEQAQILEEIIRIEIWNRLHGRAFREKDKNSKLVHPDEIKIYRDGTVNEPEQPEPLWTEEELREVARSFRSQAV